MKTTDSAWQRLVAAARHAPDGGDTAVPYGFSTRVAALALAAERPTLQTMINRMAWQALGVALVVMAFSIVANYACVSVAASEGDQDLIDPVAEVLTSS